MEVASSNNSEASLPSWAKAGGGNAKEEAGGEGNRSPEEWLELLQQLLVAGGYFRARIPTLKPFDKIVGGLAWSINASYAAEVDFDLFLREDANIGEKIQLSEKIEKALHTMKCPHLLQAHQMEGLDYPYIFPVVQWLLTRVLDARAQFGNQLRQYSQYACESKQGYTGIRLGEDGGETTGKMNVEDISVLEETYGASRQFKRKQRDLASVTLDQHIQSRLNWTLMEYGHRVLVKDLAGGDGSSAGDSRRRSSTVSGKSGQQQQSDKAKTKGLDVAQLDEEFNHLQMEEQDDGTLSGAMAAQIVGRGLNEIQQAASEYSSDSGHQSVLASYLQQKDELKKHITRASSERERHEGRSREIESELGDLCKEKEKGDAVLNRLSSELKQMKEKADDPALKELLPHVEKKHGLNKKLKDFKEACTKEREALRREAEQAQAAAEKASQLDQSDQTLLTENKLVTSKAQELQQEVSKASRAALFLGRSLDDIPNSYELTQYQKRFLELYDLVQLNLQETRSHYNTYNTLSDTKEYLHKEAKLMGSIYKGFMASSKTNSGQRAFLEQLEGIAKGVDKTLEKYQSKYSSQKDTLDASKETYQAQLQLQRQYLKTLADLQKSVNAYEAMSSGS